MRTLRILAFVLPALTLVSACKQGLGDRCQIDDDCDSDLACSTGTKVCVNPNQVLADASVNLGDARIIFDANPFDAKPQTAPDAPAPAIDAPAPDVDAPPVDAPLPDAGASKPRR